MPKTTYVDQCSTCWYSLFYVSSEKSCKIFCSLIIAFTFTDSFQELVQLEEFSDNNVTCWISITFKDLKYSISFKNLNYWKHSLTLETSTTLPSTNSKPCNNFHSVLLISSSSHLVSASESASRLINAFFTLKTDEILM